MKRTGLTLAAVCMLALGMAGCEDGPTGPHPDLELMTYAPRTSTDTTNVFWKLSAKAIMSGDSVAMVGREFVNDTITQEGISLFGQFSGGTMNGSVIDIAFSTLPTEPGEYSWKAATVKPGDFGGFSATVTDGPTINISSSPGPTKGGTFYAVSGKTVITKVYRSGTGAITGYEGYFNGTLRGVWPDNFVPTLGQMFPPGFDFNKPTLVGRNLTVHSARFATQSASSVTPRPNVQ